MQRKLFKAVLAATLAGSLTGCYRITHNLDAMASPGLAQGGAPVRSFRTEVKSTHLVVGLVNPNDKLVRDAVAREVKLAGGKRARHIRITREISFIDGLIGSVTGGLYVPSTVTIEGEIVR
jgi:hypothetical protein